MDAIGMAHGLSGHDFYPILLLFEVVEVSSFQTIRPDSEFDYLLQHSHLRQTNVVIKGGGGNASARRTAFDLWRLRNQLEPGAWSMWHLYGNDAIPEDCTDPALGFQLKLQNSIVLPDPNLPVDDLLGFRERRRSELMAFRHYIDDLCIEISKNGPDLRASHVAVEKFQIAQEEYLRVCMEPNWRKFLGSVTAKMNWSHAAIAAGSAVASATTPLGIAGSIAAGLASGFVLESARGLRSERVVKPFSYIAEIHNEINR
jgi:hypothetical protein